MPVALPLIELSALAIALLCLALALLIVAIMEKIGNVFRVIPVIGHYIADAVQSVAHAISNVLGKAEAGVDAAIGASWHALASALSESWHLLVEAATGYKDLAELVARLVYAHSGLRSLVHFAETAVYGIEHGVKTLEREWRGIEARVRDLTREITHGIGHDLRIGLRKVEHEVSGVIDGTIPALQRTVDGVTGELTQLENFIKSIPGTSYIDWAAGIVTVGLGALGLGALRCPSFLSSLKNRGCGLFNGLEDILGLLFDIAIIASICDVLPWLTVGVDEIGLGLVEGIHAAGLTACGSTYPPPPPMPAVTLTLPVVYGTTLQLAGA